MHIIHNAYSLDTQTHHMYRHRHTHAHRDTHKNTWAHMHAHIRMSHVQQQHSALCIRTCTHRHTCTQNPRVLPQAQAARLAPSCLCLQTPHHSRALEQREPSYSTLTPPVYSQAGLDSTAPIPNFILTHQAALLWASPSSHTDSSFLSLRTSRDSSRGWSGQVQNYGQRSSLHFTDEGIKDPTR